MAQSQHEHAPQQGCLQQPSRDLTCSDLAARLAACCCTFVSSRSKDRCMLATSTASHLQPQI